MQKRLKFALSLWFVAVWLLCANPAAADSIDSSVAPNSETLDDKWDDLPDADLSGWFLNFDPSQQWTNAENVATMKHWLSLVLHLGEDSSLSTQLSELGAPGSGTSGTGTSVLGTTGGETSAGTQLTLNTSTLSVTESVPEPGTLGLLAGALAMLGLYTVARDTTRVAVRRLLRSGPQ